MLGSFSEMLVVDSSLLVLALKLADIIEKSGKLGVGDGNGLFASLSSERSGRLSSEGLVGSAQGDEVKNFDRFGKDGFSKSNNNCP